MPLPNEVLAEILRLAAGHTAHELLPSLGHKPHPGVQLSQVSYQWREIALSLPIWNRIAVQLKGATYAAALKRLKAFFARGALNNLAIELFQGGDPQGTARLAFLDIVQPYASRLVTLNLFLDIDVIHDLLCLPAGTFPHLHTLALTVVHRTHDEWLVFGDEDDDTCAGTTKMSALAPLLSSFAFDQAPVLHFTPEELDTADGCTCVIYPQNIGLDFTRLTSLTIGVSLPWWDVHALLRHCVCLEQCGLNVYQPCDSADETATAITEEEEEVFELPVLRSLNEIDLRIAPPQNPGRADKENWAKPQEFNRRALPEYPSEFGGQEKTKHIPSLTHAHAKYSARPTVRSATGIGAGSSSATALLRLRRGRLLAVGPRWPLARMSGKAGAKDKERVKPQRSRREVRRGGERDEVKAEGAIQAVAVEALCFRTETAHSARVGDAFGHQTRRRETHVEGKTMPGRLTNNASTSKRDGD
ncbi:hypothetical protein C8R46DRAFT_1049531 [Mycena filopes]|nr:hypothetical protein C8R46DRAFT_1049531 [Mycena filopes]